MLEDTLTAPQVAKRLGVPVSRVRSWIYARALPATYDYKGILRVTEDGLDAFLARNPHAVRDALEHPRSPSRLERPG